MNITNYFVRFFWDRVALVWAFYLLWLREGLAASIVASGAVLLGLTCAMMAHRGLLVTSSTIAYYELLQNPIKRKFRYLGYLLAGFGWYFHFVPLICFGMTFMIYGHVRIPLASPEVNKEKISLFLWNRINQQGRVISRFLQW